MNQIIEQLLHLQLQAKIFHWQTTSYAQHSAFGSFYDSLVDLIDQLVEVYQGRYNKRLSYSKSLQLKNMKEVNMMETLSKSVSMLEEDFKGACQESDTELFNIRDEIISEINKLKYLLTLD